MPLHVWLPRAHPIAPAPVSALMSGVMIKVAIYGARARARRLGRRAAGRGSACSCSALGALSAVGGVVYALFQHDLKRLLALHSIENVGIIVLGLGACLLLRARGADTWAAFALGAALLHTLNHAVFKALLFLGAGAFERAVGSLELDRLGGLLRRMPWTGGAFLVGAMAIAGLPPLNGFASEWLTLQALLHVPAYGDVGDGIAGAIALAALAATAALAVFCFVKVVGLVLLGAAAPRTRSPTRRRRRCRCALRVVLPRASPASCSASRPACSSASLVGLAPWPAAAPTDVGLHAARTGSLPTVGIALVLVGAHRRARRCCAGSRSAAPAPTLGLRPARRARSSTGRAPASRSRCGSCSRPCCARSARSTVRTRGRRRAGGLATAAACPHLIDERLYRPVDARRARRGARTRGGCRAAASAPTSST